MQTAFLNGCDSHSLIVTKLGFEVIYVVHKQITIMICNQVEYYDYTHVLDTLGSGLHEITFLLINNLREV